MRDTDAIKRALEQLESSTTEPTVESIQASDPDDFVAIRGGATTQVSISRVLCPDPSRRDQLERAVEQAVDSLIAQRESQQRLLLETLGGHLSSQIAAEMRGPQDQLDQQMNSVKARMQAIRDRADRRRR